MTMYTELSTENAAGMQRRGKPFQPGQSGNPAGKPKGTRHHATRMAEMLMESGAQEVVSTVLKMAMQGDMTACRLVIERLIPIRRESTFNFDLPDLTCAADAPAAHQSVIDALAYGRITLSEAESISRMIDHWRHSFETQSLEERIQKLEQREH